ncbi:hypothetical protein HanXRQr2_Chr11g0506501 [Helianthus annuus]|uniref:Uncharacterized protein n=1 Tax=Helianthus annuus TaxID=4232 RepID=A0A9K3HRC3_HELAN|nr:hypothetical protein HanXRQr2_Chr11g0506501 [Helianthus annuus]KAJ0876408.1 hypothetical protein HanPSC8_Chr11g0488061 [Helianthus annuus]
MVYGFATRVWKSVKKSLKLSAGYGDWIKKFGYPEKNAIIRTLDGRTFQYEEALSSFRLFHFYQDISLVPYNYFYYKPKNDFKDRDDYMYVNKLFVHHSMLNTCPSDPVLVRWSRIKEEMSITDDHLLVFEMLDKHTFDLSVFSFAATGVEQSVDDEVPVTFVVDNHYRLKKKWAQTHGLDRKMDLTITDSAGRTWDVAIGKEFSQGCPRFNVTGMREFVRDKRLVWSVEYI